MGKNVFELWKENGERLPFRIKRDNWVNPMVFILVEKITITNYPYGIAKGKSMKIDEGGEEVISENQYHCKKGIIGCAGCYQWMCFQNQ